MAATALDVLRAKAKREKASKVFVPATDEPPVPTADEVLSMPLDVFARAGLSVVVKSSLLGEEVVFASNNALSSVDERVVYRADELQVLVRLTPETARKVHEAKKAFPGARLLDLVSSEVSE